MKVILSFFFFFELLVLSAFSQSGDHIKGGEFSKNIEYNLLRLGDGYNFNSKGDVEKLLFGNFNAHVEFFYEPSFEGASGFRIVRDKLKKSYFLEIKYVSNFEEAKFKASKKYPMRSVSSFDAPKDTVDKIRKQNQENIEKYFVEMKKLFKIESRTFSISNQFAEKMHKTMVTIIDTFKARGVPPTIFDGYSVTFRNVVGDEVWSLRIHIPTGKALKFADFCRKIIDDTLTTGKLDESNYIKSLYEF